MRSKIFWMGLICLLALSACGSGGTAQPMEDVTPVATVRGVDPKITNVVANGIVKFTDSVTGVSLDYPEGWIMDQVRGGARSPSVFVFTNYRAIPSIMDNIPPEDTVVYLTILQPSPDQTLAGLIEIQKQKWLEEGSNILTEEDVTLTSGQPGKAILLNSYVGQRIYYLFTQIGDRLIYVEGMSELSPVASIALSVR